MQIAGFIFLCFTLDFGSFIPELSMSPTNLVVFNKFHPYNFPVGP